MKKYDKYNVESHLPSTPCRYFFKNELTNWWSLLRLPKLVGKPCFLFHCKYMWLQLESSGPRLLHDCCPHFPTAAIKTIAVAAARHRTTKGQPANRLVVPDNCSSVLPNNRRHHLGCMIYWYTSSTSRGGGGCFKNRKPIGIGAICCYESRMTKQKHWLTVQLSHWPTD